MEILGKDWEALKEYLLDHEEDIAIGENDFGNLAGLFEAILGHSAKELGYAGTSETV